MRILIVEDDADIRTLIAFHIKSMGAEAIEAENGQKALSAIGSGGVDLAILDIMLPGISGIEILRRIRAEGPDRELPVIVASALNSENDIISALEEGADDYITKPFSPKILIARVKSLLRRSPSKAAGRVVSTPHGVSLDTGKRKCFVSRRRTEIIEEIKGDDYPVTERSIDVQIAALRKKLGSAGRNIATVWGIGYRYAEE